MSRHFALLPPETFKLSEEKENLFMIDSEHRDGLCFNSVAENYDRYRPGYSEALFHEIAAYAELPRGANVLEVGCGTGKATLPLLELGCSVTALEPGDELASVARRNCAAFRELRLLPVRFEEYDGEGGPFDLICSATAFHWIPEETGYPKLSALLKTGGCAALFWNIRIPASGDPVLFERIQRVYRKCRPGSRPPETEGLSRYSSCLKSFARHGFQRIQTRVFREFFTASAEEYLGYLNTCSDHLALPPSVRLPFERELSDVINDSGGMLSMENRQELYLAEKG